MGRTMAAAGCLASLLLVAGCTGNVKGATSPTSPPSPSISPSPSLPPTSPSPAPSLGYPSPVAPPAGGSALSISFISLSDAWVLARAGCVPATGGCPGTTVVLHTTSRGQHWSQVGTVPAPPGNTGVSQIRFADPRNGWAFDPQLYATHDGGATWRPVPLPGGVNALETAGGIAWAVAQAPCGASPACTTPGSLYRVSAGSDTWEPVSGVSLPPVAGTTEIALHGASVYVFSPPTLLYSPTSRTFRALPDPCPSAFERSGFAASSATNVAVLCVGDPGMGSSTKQVFTSADSGQTYHRIADAPRGGQPTGMAAGSARTIAISAASGASEIYATSGADSTWSTPLQFGDGGQGWSDLGFTDATHGVVIHAPLPQSQGTVYLTDDGGVTWYPVALKA